MFPKQTTQVQEKGVQQIIRLMWIITLKAKKQFTLLNLKQIFFKEIDETREGKETK